MLNKKRVVTAIWMGAIIIPFLLLGRYFSYGLFTVLAYIATFEMVRMHNNKRELPRLLSFIIPIFSSLLVLIIGGIQLGLLKSINPLLFCFIITCLFLLVIPLFSNDLKMSDGMMYIGFIIYGGISFGLMGVIRNCFIDASVSSASSQYDFNFPGLAIFCFVLFLTMGTDIGAYEFGCRFGKHKLIPKVSPNKSVEGSIAGSICGAIFGTLELSLTEYFLGFQIFNINNTFIRIIVIFFMALLLTIISQIGDLIASKLKREYEIKDYGNVFPGHGGVMDRFDSLILTSSFFFLILAFVGVIL